MNDILETISNQIRDLRVSKKITQQELAERTNFKRSLYQSNREWA